MIDVTVQGPDRSDEMGLAGKETAAEAAKRAGKARPDDDAARAEAPARAGAPVRAGVPARAGAPARAGDAETLARAGDSASADNAAGSSDTAARADAAALTNNSTFASHAAGAEHADAAASANSAAGAERRPDVAEIAGRFEAVRDRVARACAACGRPEDAVAILLAAKFQEPERVAAALNGGARILGHNYVQQLESSEEWLARAGAPAHRAHVIGHVQANKAGKALSYADCIETVDSLKLARRLDRLQAERIASGLASAPFDIMLQVNASGAASQFGIEPEQVLDVAGQVAELPHLRITGLMVIGAHTSDPREVAASFARARGLGEELRAAGVGSATELSMGMTADMDIAIAEGSTQVRVGTAVFGPRPNPR